MSAHQRLIREQGSERLNDEQEALARGLGLPDQQPLSLDILLVGSDEGVRRQLAAGFAVGLSEVLAAAASLFHELLGERQPPAFELAAFVGLL